MISRQTGTKVPRWASSTNSSNVVCFMSDACRSGRGRPLQKFERAALDGGGRRVLSGPPLELAARLRDEHLEAADRVGAGRARLAQEPRFQRVVDQVVHQRALQMRAIERRLVDVRPGADRRGVDQQIPSGRRRPRGDADAQLLRQRARPDRPVAPTAPPARRGFSAPRRRRARRRRRRGRPPVRRAGRTSADRAARGIRRRRSCGRPSRVRDRFSVFTAPIRQASSSAVTPLANSAVLSGAVTLAPATPNASATRRNSPASAVSNGT